MSELLTPFLRVSENVARNPVAIAIEQQRIVKDVRDFLIGLHMLEDGTHAQADIQCAARVLAVAIRVCELDGKQDDAPCRVMRGAMSALVAAAQRGFAWRTADANAVDVGLEYALEVYRSSKSKVRTQAWRDVQRMEDEA